MRTSESEFIEFHDSTLGAVRREGTAVVVELTPAYVHRSAGIPGIDEGSGWSANVHLRIERASIERTDLTVPARIADGTLWIGDKRFENGFALPLEADGSIVLQLILSSGGQLQITGNRTTANTVGEYQFLEVFRP